MQGINDPDIILADESPDMLEPTPQSHKEETTEENTEAVLSPQVEQERYWNDFLKHLEASDEQNDKSERLVCRLDPPSARWLTALISVASCSVTPAHSHSVSSTRTISLAESVQKS